MRKKTDKPKVLSERKIYEEACIRLSDVGYRLKKRIDPIAAGGAFVATGVNILVNDIGKMDAIKYLRFLADEMDKDNAETH